MSSVPEERGGIASAVFNAARQVGTVIGVAVLGDLVSQPASFIPGMHLAMGLASAACVMGLVVTFFCRQQDGPRPA